MYSLPAHHQGHNWSRQKIGTVFSLLWDTQDMDTYQRKNNEEREREREWTTETGKRVVRVYQKGEQEMPLPRQWTCHVDSSNQGALQNRDAGTGTRLRGRMSIPQDSILIRGQILQQIARGVPSENEDIFWCTTRRDSMDRGERGVGEISQPLEWPPVVLEP